MYSILCPYIEELRWAVPLAVIMVYSTLVPLQSVVFDRGECHV